MEERERGGRRRRRKGGCRGRMMKKKKKKKKKKKSKNLIFGRIGLVEIGAWSVWNLVESINLVSCDCYVMELR